MPQKKKQFRFKIPWISSSGSRAPTLKPKSLPPPSSSQAQGTPKDEPQKHPPSQPTHSPASSVAFDEFQVPSPSQPSQDLSPSSSPFHAVPPSHLPSGISTAMPPQIAAEPSVSEQEQENEKMRSPLKTPTKPPESETSPSEPLKVTPKELGKQSSTHQPDEAKEVVVVEKEPTNKAVKGNAKGTKHGESSRSSKTELQTTAPASSSGVELKTKDASNRAFRAHPPERKMMFATSSSSAAGKDIKLMTSSDPATRNVSSTSISPEINPLHQPNTQNHSPLQKAIKSDISNLVQKLATVTPTEPMGDGKNFSVVTLAGENRGATMHIGSNSARKEGSIRIHRAYKTDPEESTDVVTTDSSDENSSTSPDEKDEEVGKAYVNSNIQSVNNSLMMHGSVSERDPGVHLVLPQEPIKKPTLETPSPRAEVNVNWAEKTSYQPVIPRRCLRGMFLEPSDDEADKPRRHGCKFRCGGEKGSEIM